jgi:tetratricopeptide (TPR) repeat protein
MDRRQLLVTSAGGLVGALVPRPIFPVTKSPAKARAEFIRLWNEGHVAAYFSDFTRAIQCFERAFRLGRSLGSEHQADALSAISSIGMYTRQNENSLESNREKLNTEPASIVARLELAGNLFSLGRYDEAETEYQKVLSRGSDLSSPENKQC